MMTREEHLAWCKKRAHEYLARGDTTNAITSMLSDLTKHPETKTSGEGPLAVIGMHYIMNHDIIGARHFIDGFN
jgi:hypothetical protein